MKLFLLALFILLVCMLVSACETGYTRKNGQWTWVTNDESHGSRSHWIEDVDQSSFKVLKNKNFAADKYHVYFKGKRIKHASPEGFEILTNDNYAYAKDRNHAYFEDEVILRADPATFEVLKFPYAKDKNDAYCGTVPMGLTSDELSAFRVTNEDKLMAGMISKTALSHFLEFHPDYQWITTLNIDIQNVITGEWGTAETTRRKFKGLKEIK